MKTEGALYPRKPSEEPITMEKNEDGSVAEESTAAVSDDEILKNDLQTPAAAAVSCPSAVVASKPTAKGKDSAVARAKKEVQVMVETHEMDENDSSALQEVFKENESLKDKVSISCCCSSTKHMN